MGNSLQYPHTILLQFLCWFQSFEGIEQSHHSTARGGHCAWDGVPTMPFRLPVLNDARAGCHPSKPSKRACSCVQSNIRSVASLPSWLSYLVSGPQVVWLAPPASQSSSEKPFSQFLPFSAELRHESLGLR